jgi:electron transfer flavoprotein alpha subunit
MAVLVYVEHEQGKVNPATRAAISAALEIDSQVDLLLVGSGIDTVKTEAASIAGVGKLLVEDDTLYTHALAEAVAPIISEIGRGYSHILAAATSVGKDILPRAAAMLDVQQISEITKVISADSFERPIYAGNAIETVTSKDAVKVITVRGTAFDKAGDGGNAEIIDVPAIPVAMKTRFVDMQTSGGERPDLPAARVVVSGGRGVGSKENFSIIESLADKLGGAVGASRAAVDAGYVANDCQVGQTGKIVAPELYIAVGISGAIQHLAGMKDSKIIVAINKDENAPIFDIADYGLVGDLFTILPELEKAI